MYLYFITNSFGCSSYRPILEWVYNNDCFQTILFTRIYRFVAWCCHWLQMQRYLFFTFMFINDTVWRNSVSDAYVLYLHDILYDIGVTLSQVQAYLTYIW